MAAYSEATVLTKKPSAVQAEVAAAKHKRGGRAFKKKTSKQQIATVVPQNPDFICDRIVSIDVGGDQRVELKRKTIEEGRKILLSMYMYIAITMGVAIAVSSCVVICSH